MHSSVQPTFQDTFEKKFYNILVSEKSVFVKFCKAALKKDVQEIALSWESALLI